MRASWRWEILLLACLPACAPGPLRELAPWGQEAPFVGLNYWKEAPPPMAMERVRELGVGWLRAGGHYRDERPWTPAELLRLKAFLEGSGIPQAVVQLPLLAHREAPEEVGQEAQQVLAYLRPRAFLIGNEPDLYPRQGWTGLTPEAYAAAWRRAALAVRALAPGVPLWGPELASLERAAWLDSFLKVNADLLEAVTLHHYPFQRAESPKALLEAPEAARKALQRVRERVGRWVARPLPLVIDEFNSSWDWRGEGPFGPSTPWNALYTALALGTYLEEGVAAAFYWSLYDDGPLSLLDASATPRPAYLALEAFRGYRGLRALACPGIRVFLRQDGEALVGVNPGPREAVLDPGACTPPAALPSGRLPLPPYALLAVAQGKDWLYLPPEGRRLDLP